MSAPEHAEPPAAWARDGADWPNRGTSRFTRAGGVTWHVQRMGEGEPLLLIHGAGAATHSWRALMPALAPRFDVIAPDLPQHGFSRAAGGGKQSLPAMARAMADLLEALGAAPAIVVGHSAGAAIALRLALDGRIAPRAIIGLNAALAPFRGLAGLLFPPAAKMLALNPATPWMVSAMAGREAQARRLIEGTGSRIDASGLGHYRRLFARADHVSGALGMMAAWDLGPLLADLPRLATPLHLVVGTQDRAVPPDEARRLAAAHGVVRLHEVAGAGHLIHEERPDDIAAMIAKIATGARWGAEARARGA